MKLCQLASGQSFSVTRHAETGFKGRGSLYVLLSFGFGIKIQG